MFFSVGFGVALGSSLGNFYCVIRAYTLSKYPLVAPKSFHFKMNENGKAKDQMKQSIQNTENVLKYVPSLAQLM